VPRSAKKTADKIKAAAPFPVKERKALADAGEEFRVVFSPRYGYIMSRFSTMNGSSARFRNARVGGLCICALAPLAISKHQQQAMFAR
jgi:hypothetical protein